MEKRSVAVILVLALMVVGGFAVPSSAHPTSGLALAPARAPAAAPAVVATPHAAGPATTPAAGAYPRLVMIETFTAEWCVYCEEESQALYYIEHHTSANVMQIGELHICYSSTNCGDSYTTPDGTANTRGSFYGVNAFPTVFFDGDHSIVGAAPTLNEMETWYDGLIANASMVPGNVSFAQSAVLTAPGTLSSHTTITSAVNGTYHAITYILEYIGKNDSTGHDLGWVVRGSLVDQNVALTAGTTTEISGTKSISSTWNIQHLAIVTLVQQNSTKIIENAAMVPVSTMATTASVAAATINGGANTTVTVQVVNSSTAAPLAGAAVTLSASGGTVTPTLGLTNSYGMFTANFSAPRVSAVQTFQITAQASLANYTPGPSATTSVTVNPLYPPGLPANFSVVPEGPNVLLNWSPPASGGGGVTYHVSRSSSQVGGYGEIAITTQTSYLDTTVQDGQSYWYTVSAQDIGGYSANATSISATAVVVTPTGIGPYTSWWFSVGSLVFNSSTSAALSFHLEGGSYTYAFGSYSNAYVAPVGLNNLAVGSSLLQLTVAFLPNYATLTGTVSPATATVTVNGSSVPVVNGAFSESMLAATYTVVVTAAGYQENTTSVTLSPGNTSKVAIALQPVSSSGSTGASLGGLSTTELGLLVAGVVVALAIVAAGALMLRRGRSPRRAPPESPPTSEP